ncbi:Uncharacterized protein FWK35_00033388, partial [Aphis craccivora]
NQPRKKNARYERSKKLQALESNTLSSTVTTIIFKSLIELNDSVCGYNKTMNNKSTLVAFDGIENYFVFNCEYEGNIAATQVTIPKNFMKFDKPKTEDKSCGVESSNNNSCLSCNTFHGFQSIESEQSLKDIKGITFKIFDFLLSLIPNNINSQTILSKENYLLIFLMKLKTTVSRVFLECLKNILSKKCKNLIFWPCKDTIWIHYLLHSKKKYPNCRCIIDCFEIKVEQPKTVKQRVYMYSHYKGCYTVKVLVAITPNGMVSFLSKAYGGRSNDSFNTNDCGFLDKLEIGDEVLAD